MTVDLELADRFVRHLRIYARGEGQAITAVELCPALGLKPNGQGRRHLRACVHHAIESGELVASGQNGYWIPATEAEARGSAARLRSEAREMEQRAQATERLAARMFAPQDLFSGLEESA